MLYEMFAVLFALSALGVTGASAQQFDRLSGQYQCIEDCTGRNWHSSLKTAWSLI